LGKNGGYRSAGQNVSPSIGYERNPITAMMVGSIRLNLRFGY